MGTVRQQHLIKTWCAGAHPSPNQAQRCLTSVIVGEPVLSTRHDAVGREDLKVGAIWPSQGLCWFLGGRWGGSGWRPGWMRGSLQLCFVFLHSPPNFQLKKWFFPNFAPKSDFGQNGLKKWKNMFYVNHFQIRSLVMTHRFLNGFQKARQVKVFVVWVQNTG